MFHFHASSCFFFFKYSARGLQELSLTVSAMLLLHKIKGSNSTVQCSTALLRPVLFSLLTDCGGCPAPTEQLPAWCEMLQLRAES